MGEPAILGPAEEAVALAFARRMVASVKNDAPFPELAQPSQGLRLSDEDQYRFLILAQTVLKYRGMVHSI